MTGSSETGSRKMFELVSSLAAQLRTGPNLPGLQAVRPGPRPVQRVFLCGMGGSAIAGDLVQPLIQSSQVPLTVWRDYNLPHWARAGDTVLVSSYSGNTEETLSGLAEARLRGCRLIGITSGGELADSARDLGFPVVQLPGGLPPRASLGLGLGALVRILGNLGLIAEVDEMIEDAAHRLEAGAEYMGLAGGLNKSKAVTDDNPPVRDLAERLKGRVPVIYTLGAEAHGPGRRMQAQLNENSKVPAHLAAFPELDHNDLVGWDLDPTWRDRYSLIVLKGEVSDERLLRRAKVTCDLLQEDFASVQTVSASGGGTLGRIMALVQYGDYLSCHLAALKDVDPVPVTRIENLKSALADGAVQDTPDGLKS